MTYREFPNWDSTFIVVHSTGSGVMEDPSVDQGPVFGSNSREWADERAKELKAQDNTPEEIESTWCRNYYSVNVNTLTEMGKYLYEQFAEKFDK